MLTNKLHIKFNALSKHTLLYFSLQRGCSRKFVICVHRSIANDAYYGAETNTHIFCARREQLSILLLSPIHVERRLLKCTPAAIYERRGERIFHMLTRHI